MFADATQSRGTYACAWTRTSWVSNFWCQWSFNAWISCIHNRQSSCVFLRYATVDYHFVCIAKRECSTLHHSPEICLYAYICTHTYKHIHKCTQKGSDFSQNKMLWSGLFRTKQMIQALSGASAFTKPTWSPRLPSSHVLVAPLLDCAVFYEIYRFNIFMSSSVSWNTVWLIACSADKVTGLFPPAGMKSEEEGFCP